MDSSHESLYARRRPADLIDRVVQLRRVLAGIASDNDQLRRELMRLKRANRALERELRAAVPYPPETRNR